MEKELSVLFEPLEMPNLKLKNRLFMAPMGTAFPMPQMIDYLVERAKGEVALIHTGLICVHPSGRPGGRPGEKLEFCLEKDDDIKEMAPLAKTVKEAGAKVVAQLNHAGRYSPGRITGMEPVAPSAITSRYTGETPRALTTGEADDLVTAFADGARRARESGFDGIEILASSGYLVAQFLSPLTNKRTDKYGGDTLGRATFLLSVVSECRKQVGNDFNICVKFDGDDGMDGGRVLEDSLRIAPEIVNAGADRLHMWAGWHEATRPMLPMWVQRGAFAHYAEAIKNVVDVPVSTVGRINDPYVAAEIIAGKKADLVGLGRTLLCDPMFVKKTLEGRTDEIRRCIACCYCFDGIQKNIRGPVVERAGIKCALNPELGIEGENRLSPVKEKKKVVIVGGGPAGLETARVAAIRGHEVTLYEEKEELGGLLHLAVIPPHKEELKNIKPYYEARLKALDVDVKLGEAVTPEKLNELKPDVVVLATGANALLPPIPGIDGKNVATALDVLKGETEVGDHVVVMGGGLIGVETAEWLADKGKKVTLMEMLKSIGSDIGITSRWGVLMRVRKKMKIMTLTKIVKIKEGCVEIETANGDVDEISADTVVVAAGLKCRTDLADQLEQPGFETHTIGCCRLPGQIAEAVSEAFEVGCKI